MFNKIIFIVLGILVALLALMAVFKICPPQGPWPMPPWCEGGIQLPKINLPELPSTPSTEGTPSTKQETKSAPTKAEIVTANVIVTVPYWTTGDVYVGLGNNPKYIKLERVNDVIFKGTISMPKNSAYYYASGEPAVKEAPISRKFLNGNIYDFVQDWENSSKQIGKNDFQKSFYIGACHGCGVSYTKGNFIEPIKRSYDEIKKLGGNWVNLVPVWFVAPDYRGNDIAPIYASEFRGTSGWVHATISDGDLVTLMREARARGLKVYLTPHLAPENWGPGVKGKGDLEPTDPDKFFSSYKNFIGHYAILAEQNGVEMFSIGNELDTLTQYDHSLNPSIDKTARWRDVIASVRKVYKGKLTYSVSCIDEQRCGPTFIKFWDDLDVIGWEWYTPIASGTHESIASMKVNAARIITNLMKPLSQKYNKPVVLTEIGWEAYPGACAHTYGTGSSKGGDRIEQSSCYEAVFQAIENEDFIKGIHIWTWTANLVGDKFPWIWTDSANEVRFSITEKEIAKWYGKIGLGL